MRPLKNAPARRTLGAWIAILAAGVVFLFFRYDWGTNDDQFAERGFLLSAYLFVLLIPTLYYLLRWLLANETAARVITGVVFVITVLPYHLLGLDQYFYYKDRPHWYTVEQIKPSTEFFPGGSLHTFPWDWLFMPLLFLLGAGVIWGVWKLRARAGFVSKRSIPVLLTIAFAVICLQSYLHTDMRSPYTTLGHFENDPVVQRWYHVYHFDDGSGASIGDQYVFSPMEDYFQGAHHQGNNMLLRRPFSFYVASQGSFFVNTFYVWMALNCLFWLASVLATGRLVARLATERAGVIAGAFVVASPAFLAFVSTPAMYLQYYAAIAIALCLFEELIVRPPQRRTSNYVLYAAVLTLCALVYDLLPLLVFLLAYGLARKIPFKPLAGSLAAAAVIPWGFSFLVTGILGIKIDPLNSGQISAGLRNTRHLVTNPSLVEWYDLVVRTLSVYVELLLHAMFVLPVLVALFGIHLLKDRPRQVFVGGLIVMTLLTMAFLQIGKTSVAFAPRLVYVAFPAIFLLAALALDTTGLKRKLEGEWWEDVIYKLRVAAPYLVIAVMLVLINVDIFGYPTQYVEFFTNDPPTFTP